MELTDEETRKAIWEAKQKKLVSLEDERKKALAKIAFNDVMRPWTAGELLEVAKNRIQNFLRDKFDDPNYEFLFTAEQLQIATALTLYFTNDKEFEELESSRFNTTGSPFSLNKGIWLFGNPGVGKTLLMNAFSKNKRQCFRLLQCPKIVSSFTVDGYDAVSQYTKRWKEPTGGSTFYQPFMGICYNDLGTEQLLAKSYGNNVNVMEHIFLETYENNVPFYMRHVTTNITADQIEKMYGIRVKDRIRESFNIMVLGGSSQRR